MATKPLSDADTPDHDAARLPRRLPWRTLDGRARVTLPLALLYAALLLAVPWLIIKGPDVMSPSVPAFAWAAEDGRATLHAAAIKARPAIVMRSKRAPAPK